MSAAYDLYQREQEERHMRLIRRAAMMESVLMEIAEYTRGDLETMPKDRFEQRRLESLLKRIEKALEGT